MRSPKPPPSAKQGGGSVPSAYSSPTFKLDMSIKVDAPVGAMSISPSSRDVVLASRQGLHIVDLDNPYDPPRYLPHITAWSVADVQWCPHASEPNWVVSTSNQNAIVWNLALPSNNAIEFVLKSHTRAITDINFSAHDPNILATCSIDSFVHCWDLRAYQRPAMSFCDWFAGATQVKYNRTDEHVLASAHDRYLYIWDTRMGTKELRKIDAHSTKIYGIDWNRTRRTSIITCALDKSVRFWDYEKTPSDDTPERIIHTSFPVWRARHTPFGWGVMTMPQRGDTSLYLWDLRTDEGGTKDDPVAKFDGHTGHVKEFVWRWRGGEQPDGLDDREFQLISWSLDRDIRLWDVDKDVVAKVGHDPTKKLRFRITRKGARYMTFRDEAAVVKEYAESLREKSKDTPKLLLTPDGRRSPRYGARSSGLGQGIGRALSLSQASGVSVHRRSGDRRYEKSLTGMREGGFMRGRRRRPKEMNPIMWMKGVKIGRKASEQGSGTGMDSSRTSARGDFGLTWEAPENLGDEISFVGSKFPNVNFEKVNIAARTCTVALTGPWGAGGKLIFVRAVVSFPPEYPTDALSIPVFQLEKTNAIPEAHIAAIDTQLIVISQAHVSKRRVCLEACISYLLGERANDALLVGSGEDEDISSDDEEIVNIDDNVDEEDVGVDSVHVASQASVPLPKACGATWSHDGRLVCFFPPKEERSKTSLFSPLTLREGERRSPGGTRVFEGFGRLFMDSRMRGDADKEDFLSESSFTSEESSDEDTELNVEATLGWHLRGGSLLAKRFRKGGSTGGSTQRSTGTGVKTIMAVGQRKSVVAIHDMSHVLPSKLFLAHDYKIGDGPEVCQHNAAVAETHGCAELADVWRLLEMTLCNDVPLEAYSSPRRGFGDWRKMVIVIARRATLEKRRRDSGLGKDLVDDVGDADLLDLSESDFWGRVKWGGHPFGGRWLVEELFKYYESKADIQMLGMLSCVLAETGDKSGREEPVLSRSSTDIPKSKKLLPFDHTYYPNTDLTALPYNPTYPLSPSHHSASLTPLGTHGSYGSSSGDVHFGSDPLMPFSMGATPPSTDLTTVTTTFSESFPHHTSAATGMFSISSSPEQHHHSTMHNYHFRRSNSAISRALASINPSPPSRRRPSPTDLMMSAFATTPGVTWGATTTFGSGSKDSSPGMFDTSDEDSSPDDLPHHRPFSRRSHRTDPITITLHNQVAFDDAEAAVEVPLLNPDRQRVYESYRHTYANALYVWRLQIQRLEVLKYNPLPEEPHPGNGSGTPQDSGLEIAGHCSKCGAVLRVTLGAKGECKNCKRRQVTMTCVICETIVKGVYAPCTECGHVSHAECHRAWFAEEEEEGGRECPTGCGCRCASIVEEGCEAEENKREEGGGREDRVMGDFGSLVRGGRASMLVNMNGGMYGSAGGTGRGRGKGWEGYVW